MEMTSIKTVAVFVIMFGCFAVLYPKIFHPMILQILGFGFNAKSKNFDDDGLHPRLHPRERMNGPAPKASPPHARPGVHPGMRAAAEMRKQAAQAQQGSGRGMIGYMLPLYAVGIIIYLVYTMSKVFVKGDDKKSNMNLPGDHANKPQNSEREIADMEMNLLRKRLEETETQMQKILTAMEVVKQRTGTIETAADTVKTRKQKLSTPTTVLDQKKKKSESKKKSEASADLSPDIETYDIVNGRDDCDYSDTDESSPSNSADEYEVNSEDAVSSDLLTLKKIQHHLETVAEKLEPMMEEEEEDEEEVAVETITSSVASADEDCQLEGLRQRTKTSETVS